MTAENFMVDGCKYLQNDPKGFYHDWKFWNEICYTSRRRYRRTDEV